MKNLLKRYIPNFIVNRKVAGDFQLTFDDGPHPEYTKKLLDVLDNFDHKAVFYIQGNNAEKYPDIVKDIVKRGHLVGNHTYSHCYDDKGIFSYIRDINACSKVINEILGYRVRIFRPPYGVTSITSLLACYITGHRFMHMNLGGKEWNEHKEKSARFVSDYLMSKVQYGDVIVLHDNHSNVPEIVEKFLSRK